MADIRINALATTAASTASDDFVAVDGSANGTRKLNAYSPTFGGNLTVSGTGTFSGNLSATGEISCNGSGGALRADSRTGSGLNWYIYNPTGADLRLFNSTGGNVLILTNAGAATLTGNLTVSGGTVTSGSGTLTLNSSANTVVLQSAGTTALTLDSSQNATFAGTIQLNSDSGLYIKQGNIARWTSTGLSSGTARADIYADSAGSFFIRTNGTTQALQINSSQNATFAGSITTAAPTTGTAGAWKLGVKVDATTTLDTTKYLQVDIGGTLYKVALVTS